MSGAVVVGAAPVAADPSRARLGWRRVAAVALSAAALLNCWFLVALLLPGTLAAGNTFVSELSSRGQPFSGWFRAADLLTGMCLLVGTATGWWRAPSNRWSVLAALGLAGFGLVTAIDSGLPLDCPPSVEPACRAAERAGAVSWQHHAHSITGVLASLAIITACYALAHATRTSLTWANVSRLAAGCANLQVLIAGAVSVLWLADVVAVGWWQRLSTLLTSSLLLVLAVSLWRREWDLPPRPAWPELAQRRSQRVPVGTAEIDVSTPGSPPAPGAPVPVVLVNGLSLPAEIWLPVIAQMPGVRAYAFDRPGIGNSSGAPGLPLAEQLAHLRAVIASTGAPAAMLVAHSHGAVAAVTLARTDPQLVRGLILVDPSIAVPHGRVVHLVQHLAVAGMAAMVATEPTSRLVGRPSTWLQLRVGTARPDRYWPPRRLRAEMAARPRLRATIAELRVEPADLAAAAAVAERTGALPADLPVVILASGRAGWPARLRSGQWVAALAEYARELGSKRCIVVSGAHLLMLDSPQRIAEHVADMSQRLA